MQVVEFGLEAGVRPPEVEVEIPSGVSAFIGFCSTTARVGESHERHEVSLLARTGGQTVSARHEGGRAPPE
jgi:hypothetical protein